MPKRLLARNWTEFQHYKDRCPPWIRLHRKLLDNKDFQRLPDASRALAPMLWLLASESLDGSINADADDISFRLRQPEEWVQRALKPLIEKGFFAWAEDDASDMLASGLRRAVPEAEAEAEERQRESEPAAPAPAAPSPPHPRQKPKSRKIPLPDGFAVSERVRAWAASKGYGQLDAHFESFVSKAKARSYTYADWDEGFMGAVRDDWAKLRQQAPNQPQGGSAAPKALESRQMLDAQSAVKPNPELARAAREALQQRRLTT